MSNTAIQRKVASTPARWLLENGYLKGCKTILDYGCGYGADVEFLRLAGFKAEGYDPHTTWCDRSVLVGGYDVVLLTYVLNTIELPRTRNAVLRYATEMCKAGGRVFVTVRRDIKQDGPTQRGWQGNVAVPGAKSVLRKPWFELYELT
jgi:DNA phosphorothioation-associated putative methyltransferase